MLYVDGYVDTYRMGIYIYQQWLGKCRGHIFRVNEGANEHQYLDMGGQSRGAEGSERSEGE